MASPWTEVSTGWGEGRHSNKALIGWMSCLFVLGTLEFEVSIQWPERFLEPPVKIWSKHQE